MSSGTNEPSKCGGVSNEDSVSSGSGQDKASSNIVHQQLSADLALAPQQFHGEAAYRMIQQPVDTVSQGNYPPDQIFQPPPPDHQHYQQYPAFFDNKYGWFYFDQGSNALVPGPPPPSSQSPCYPFHTFDTVMSPSSWSSPGQPETEADTDKAQLTMKTTESDQKGLIHSQQTGTGLSGEKVSDTLQSTYPQAKLNQESTANLMSVSSKKNLQDRDDRFPPESVFSPVSEELSGQPSPTDKTNMSVQNSRTSCGELPRVQDPDMNYGKTTDVLLNGIEVRGLPHDVSEDTVVLYFENKRRNGGGPVQEVVLRGDGSALVFFKDSQVIENILAKECHKIQGKNLEVSKYVPEMNKPEISVMDETEATVVVRGCAGIQEDILELYFENTKKSGGGKVKTISRSSFDEDDEDDAVYITFYDSDVVEKILKQEMHKLGNKVLHISLFKPTKPEIETATIDNDSDDNDDEEIVKDTVCVSNYGDLTNEMFEIYFESVKRSGGGEVKEIVRDVDSDVVHVIFKEPDAAASVLRRDHTLGGHNLQVTARVIKRRGNSPSDDLADEEIVKDTVCVSGYADLTDEMIEMYFESVKRSGGGAVKEIVRDEDSDVLHVIFEEPEAAASVLRRDHTLGGHNLQVTARVIKRRGNSPSDDLADEEIVKDTVCVSGYGDLTDDMIEIYFESEKKSGGGEVKEVVRDVDSDVVHVIFKEPEVAANVLMRDHNLGGFNLQVTMLMTKKDYATPDFSDDTEDISDDDDSMYVLEVTGISENTTEDTITLYFENRRRNGGGDVEKVEMNNDNGTALVYFVEGDVVARVIPKVHQLEKKIIQVSPFLPKKHPQKMEDPLKWLRGYSEGTVLELTGCTGINQDMLEMYFENKRRSGGKVSEIRRSDNDDTVYLIYESAKDAENVAKKKHTVDKTKVSTKVYKVPNPPKPRPRYPDRFLIENLKETTSKEALIEFLKKKCQTQCTSQSFTYGEEPGTVMVTVAKMRVNLRFLHKQCSKHPLEGAFLQISCVPISNCILVQGLKPTSSGHTLALYFESKRSGNNTGTEVEEYQYTEGSEYALVYFKDHSVISKILQKKEHKIGDTVLKVSLYTECLGTSGGHTDPSWFKLPQPIILDSINPHKLRFIKESQLNCHNFEKQLEADYAHVKWEDQKIVLECTLQKDMKNSRNLIKTWTKSVTESMEKFLSLLDAEEIHILNSIWKAVLECLSALTKPDPDAGMVYEYESTSLVVIVGHSFAMSGLADEIKGIVKEVEEEQERKKCELTETIKTLKPLQLKYLDASGFPETARSKYKGLNVNIKIAQGEITFTGLLSDIKSAQLDMYESTQGLTLLPFSSMSDDQMNFLQNSDVEEYIVKRLEANQIVGAWHFEKNSLVFVASTDENVKKLIDTVQESIKVQLIHFDQESIPLLDSPEWKQIIEDFNQTFGNLFQLIPSVPKRHIVIVSTDDNIARIIEDVSNFFEEKTIYSETVQYTTGIQSFLTQHMDTELKAISSSLKTYSVNIMFDSSSSVLQLRGTKAGLNIALRKVEDLTDQVIHVQQVFDKPGIAKLILSEEGKQYISVIESSKRCVIEEQYEGKQRILGSSNISRQVISGGGPHVQTSNKLAGGQTLYISQGDITKMTVDVIVNAANSQLLHGGGLAGAIVAAGGTLIQTESTHLVSRFGSIKVGKVAVTKPGNLPCKSIVHAVGPTWSGGHNQEEELLREAIFSVLEETDQQNFTSIAIPALSTGIYRYPVAKATRVIADAVKTYFTDNPQSQVMEVYLCDNNINTITEFKAAVEEKFGQSKKHPQIQTWSPAASYQISANKTFLGKQFSQDPFSYEPPQHEVMSASSSIKIRLVHGEIASQKADAIVNTAERGLNLSKGSVSKSILDVGGPKLQRECSTKYPNGIDLNEVAVTSAGNLNCVEVFHIYLPNWNPYSGKKAVKEVTTECLRVASKKNFHTIAFPALGTGNLRYPRKTVAKAMFETIHKFGCHTTSLKEAIVVVYPADTDTVQDFESEYKNLPQSFVKQPSNRKGRSFSTRTESEVIYTRHTNADDDRPKHQPVLSASGVENIVPVGKVQLTIKQGDITKEPVNCIVNSTNSALDLSQGQVSRTLLKAGGEDLMQECRLKSDEMALNGVVVTKALGLRSDYIVHVNIDQFTDLKEAVMSCLDTARQHSSRVTSIAFPALGTGQKSVKVETVSKQVIDAIREYQDGKSRKHIISDVRIVIFQQSMLEPFVVGVAGALKEPQKGFFRKAAALFGSSKTSKGNEPEILQVDNTPDLELHFFSDDRSSIEEAVTSLMSHFTPHLTKKKLEEVELKNLESKWNKEIMDEARKFTVKIDFDKLMGVIWLQGTATDVSSVSDAIHRILRKVQREENEEQKAEILARVVQWFYTEIDNRGNDNLKKYEPIANKKIEDAFKSNKKDVRLTDTAGIAYIVDFQQNVEYPERKPNDKLDVVRRDLIEGASFELPTTWSQMSQDSEMFDVTPSSKEYSDVEKDFLSGTQNQFTIVKIQRVQTKFLWQQYMAKTHQLDEQNPKSITNERILWHGTAASAISNIRRRGFNRSYCGKNATHFGEGVYFAVNASYSAQNRYSPADYQGLRYMFRARVLTGEYTQGKTGLRVLPYKDLTQTVQFDSAVERTNAPTIFVIFNDTQAYPEYLITFQ